MDFGFFPRQGPTVAVNVSSGGDTHSAYFCAVTCHFFKLYIIHFLKYEFIHPFFLTVEDKIYISISALWF